jgi:hypothetical protein
MMRVARSLPHWHRGVVIPFTLIGLLLVAIVALGHAPPPLTGPIPRIPPYPNAISEATYPGGWELRLLGEGFGGFDTADSPEVVFRFYAEQLPQHGWHDGWYRNIFGYCYNLLIIPSLSFDVTPPMSTTRISLKLRQAFGSELDKNAPTSCK